MSDRSLVDLLAEKVAVQPAREALVQGAYRCSYAELWSRVITVARGLKRRDITSGDRVVMIMENSADYAAAYYAALSIGAVAVALNTGLKGDQLSHIIAHADARIVLRDDKFTGLEGPALAVTDLIQEDCDARAEALADEWVTTPARGDQLASIVYTSGTTGRPKGVMLSANNLLANTLAIVDYLNLRPEDRMLCVLPFYYAYGNSVLHSHLLAGACLVLENSLMYPQQVLEKMNSEGVTGFAGVPSTFRLLLQRSDLCSHPLPALRLVTQAGGPLSPADIQKVRQAWPQAKFFVMYGQTEATSRISYLPPERLDDKAGSVGLPLPGVRVAIMDETGREKGAGETGEICVAGPNVMLGYWRDETSTAAKFFGPWLRTGDLGFRDEEGYLTILGRRSDMIKTGDHRVAPEEIEQVIAALDNVAEVAVVGIPDRLLGQVIKAYVVLAEGASLDKRDILRHCKQQCAHYKVPKQVEFLPELPKTASGKVQRFKLQEVSELAANCI